MPYEEHQCRQVQQALVRLNDALCAWERNTGINSVLIIREESGWSHRSQSGKPGIPDDITDEMLLGCVMKQSEKAT